MAGGRQAWEVLGRIHSHHRSHHQLGSTAAVLFKTRACRLLIKDLPSNNSGIRVPLATEEHNSRSPFGQMREHVAIQRCRGSNDDLTVAPAIVW